MSTRAQATPLNGAVIVTGGTALAALAALVWSYWPTLAELIEFWRFNEDYSVGQLVPFVALFLVWRQRDALRKLPVQTNWWGLALVLAAQAIRFLGVYFAYASAERFSLWLTVVGLVLWLGGTRVWRELFWVQLFLALMLPLPQRVHEFVSLPLQEWATSLGVFGLELCGFFVRQEGNVLHLNDAATVMVAEACSGLRMLTAFVFTAAVLCFLVDRPSWHRAVLLVSSIPVALIANGARVLATSVFIYYVDSETAEQQFHDVAGLLMMPVALLILLAELRFLSALTQPPAKKPARKDADGGKSQQAARKALAE